jgi:uroporphyrin-III C-methyltransferase
VQGLRERLPASVPAAIVQHASIGAERRLLSTLGRLVADAAAHGFGSPAVLIIGDVLREAEADVARPLGRHAAAGR